MRTSTRGPWFVAGRPLDDGRARIENGTYEGAEIAICEWHNVSLIAAAPDLLAVCREALGAIWELHPWESRESYHANPSVKAIERAIARAEVEL